MVSITGAVWTPHARSQAAERSISDRLVESIPSEPDLVTELRPGRVVAQGPAIQGTKAYLVRVVVDVDRNPPEIVTVYRTSKLAKYRSPQ